MNGRIFKIPHSRYSRQQIPSDTLHCLFPSNIFLPRTYHFSQMSRPAKICMQNRYYEEQIHRVPLQSYMTSLGSEYSSQFSTNQSIIAEFGRALLLQVTKRFICRKVCFRRLIKFQVKKQTNKQTKKGLIGLHDSYQDRLVLFFKRARV